VTRPAVPALYAYALLEKSARGPWGRGVARERLAALPLHGMRAVVGAVKRPPRSSTPTLLRQARVLTRLGLGGRALLPFRFGTCAADASTLTEGLADRAAALRRALRHVRGRRQMNVRFRASRPTLKPAAAPKAPRAYLEARAAAWRSANTAAELAAWADALKRLGVEERVVRERRNVTVFHLVPVGRLPAYRALWRGAAAKALGLRVSGPFPPFAFGPRL
jgi:hypothetical protein